MRRKDREMSKAFGLLVIDEAPFGTLCINDVASDTPYAIPLSIVRSGETLYFHAAKSGQKHDLFKNEQKVRIVFVGYTNVPDLFSAEALAEAAHSQTKSTLLSKVFTTEYRSTIVTGTLTRIDPLTEPETVKKALQLVCEKYTPDKMAYFEAAFESGATLTDVYRIEIETLTAKRKQFNAAGEELKWQKDPDLA